MSFYSTVTQLNYDEKFIYNIIVNYTCVSHKIHLSVSENFAFKHVDPVNVVRTFDHLILGVSAITTSSDRELHHFPTSRFLKGQGHWNTSSLAG